MTITQQPDDPGTQEQNCYAPVRFEPSGFGRELIKLGTINIGEILPQYGKLVRATVLFRLPDAPRTMFCCTSMKLARHKAAALTREWLQAAGLKS